MGVADKALDISLKGEDEILASISMKSLRVVREELIRLLSRCESEIATMVSHGEGQSQRCQDRIARREKLSSALDEIAKVEAEVRSAEREGQDGHTIVE